MRKVILPRQLLPRWPLPIRLFGCLAAIMAFVVAAASLGYCWTQLAGRSDQPMETPPPGAILLVCAPGQPDGQYHLLKASLAAAGFPSQVWNLPDVETTDAKSMQEALDQLAVLAGCGTEQIWLAAVGGGVSAVWRLGSQLDVCGQILIMPQNLASIDAKSIRQWPVERPIAILSAKGSENSYGDDERAFFERLTGEDAVLFPGYSDPGFLQSQQYFSASGKTWLSLYPGFFSTTAMFSFRVLTGVTDWLSDWSANEGMSDYRYVAGRKALVLTALLWLAGLMFLTVPLGMILFFDKKPADLPPVEKSAGILPRKRHKYWLEILIWLPAGGLGIGLGVLLAWLAGDSRSWLLPGVAFMPGCRGWLLLLIRRIQKRWQDDELDSECEPQIKAAPQSAFFWTGRIAGTIGLAIIVAAVSIWSFLAFGLTTSPKWIWLAWPVLVAFNWPAGMAMAGKGIDQTEMDGTLPEKTWHAAIWQHLPFLVLPVWAIFAGTWAGLTASLLLLIVHAWSVSLGKAAALLLGRPGIGSWFCAAGYVSGLLLPPIFYGLSAIH